MKTSRVGEVVALGAAILSSSCVKFSDDLLRLMAKQIILESEHETFNRHYDDPKDHKKQKRNEKIKRETR